MKLEDKIRKHNEQMKQIKSKEPSNEEIIERIYKEKGYRVDYESFIWGRRIGSSNLMRKMIKEKIKQTIMRTANATKIKQEQQAMKNDYIIRTYLKMINDKMEKEILKNISESEMAERVKKSVEPDLRKVVVKGKPVLTRKVDRNGNVKYTGLSPRTIIRILRNRDKSKIPFYPWENK